MHIFIKEELLLFIYLNSNCVINKIFKIINYKINIFFLLNVFIFFIINLQKNTLILRIIFTIKIK